MTIPFLKHKLHVDWRSATKEALLNKKVPPGKRRQKKYKNILTYSHLYSGALVDMSNGPLVHTVMPGVDIDGYYCASVGIPGPFQTPWHEAMFLSNKHTYEMSLYYNKMVGYIKGTRRKQRSNLARRNQTTGAPRGRGRAHIVAGLVTGPPTGAAAGRKKKRALLVSVSRGNRGKQNKGRRLWNKK